MRIEINLKKEVATAIRAKAIENNHSRKSYIELLCIRDVEAQTIKERKLARKKK